MAEWVEKLGANKTGFHRTAQTQPSKSGHAKSNVPERCSTVDLSQVLIVGHGPKQV